MHVCLCVCLSVPQCGFGRGPMVPELSPALTSYLPPFHHYQAPESPDSTFPEAPGPNHTCWCCWRGTGPLASCCPWLDSLCSRLSSRSGPTLPPSVSRSSAEGICRSRGFSLGLADLWGWGEMSTRRHAVAQGMWWGAVVGARSSCIPLGL